MSIWDKKMPHRSTRCDRCGKAMLRSRDGVISRDMLLHMEATGEQLCFECVAKMMEAPASDSEEQLHLPPITTPDDRPCVFFFFPSDAPHVPQYNLEDIARYVLGRERVASAVFKTCRVPGGSEEQQRQAMTKEISFWQSMQSDPESVLFDQKTIRHPEVEFTIIIGYHGSRH